MKFHGIRDEHSNYGILPCISPLHIFSYSSKYHRFTQLSNMVPSSYMRPRFLISGMSSDRFRQVGSQHVSWVL